MESRAGVKDHQMVRDVGLRRDWQVSGTHTRKHNDNGSVKEGKKIKREVVRFNCSGDKWFLEMPLEPQ